VYYAKCKYLTAKECGKFGSSSSETCVLHVFFFFVVVVSQMQQLSTQKSSYAFGLHFDPLIALNACFRLVFIHSWRETGNSSRIRKWLLTCRRCSSARMIYCTYCHRRLLTLPYFKVFPKANVY